MKTIKTHIEEIKQELDSPNTNSQRSRHLKGELNSLEKYQEDHPNDEHNPTTLELYCNENPESLECRIYE
jgi:hypothetical protein